MVSAAQLDNALRVRASILALDLKRHPKFDTLSPEEFAAIYNGVGPDSWPAEVRAALTAIYDGLEELPGVHDVDFHFSDGTRAGFEATLDRWAQNGRILLRAKWPLWQVWRYRDRARAWAKIRLAYRTLQAFSWPVYVDTCRARHL